jgi:hypothetical protein
MSKELATILLLSTSVLTVAVGYRDIVRRHPRRFVPTVCLLALSAAVYVVAFPDKYVETKGTLQEGVAVGLCYVAMLLGMVAQYFYKQGERGSKTFQIEWVDFLMPIFASPIVFIPLLTITSDLSLSGAFTKSKLMVYLVSFQNGFFWKSFFDERQHAVANAAKQAPLVVSN